MGQGPQAIGQAEGLARRAAAGAGPRGVSAMRRPLLVIGLDGYEPSVADRLLAQGEMPNLRVLAADSALYKLDHGEAKRTGLAWEHFALGKEPAAYGRHAAVHFDPATYRVSQCGTAATP